MNEHRALIPDLDAETVAQVDLLAAARGVSREAYAGDVIRKAVEAEAELDAKLRSARQQIERGDFLEHDAFVADLRRWRERVRAR